MTTYAADILNTAQPAQSDDAEQLGPEVRKLKEYVARTPQRVVAANYQLDLTDVSKEQFQDAADVTQRTVTLPTNATVAFPVGTQIPFCVENGAGGLLISPAVGVTLRKAGSGTTGVATLSPNADALLHQVKVNVWYISGAGVA